MVSASKRVAAKLASNPDESLRDISPPLPHELHALSKIQPTSQRTSTTMGGHGMKSPDSNASRKHGSAISKANVFRISGFCILYSLLLSTKILHFFFLLP